MRQNSAVATLLGGILGCSGTFAHTAIAPPPDIRHLVLVSVDGLRPDAVAAAGASHLKDLVTQSAWTFKARTVGKPETLPSHVSMLTGLAPARHGVNWNNNRGVPLELPSLFTRVQDSGGATALLFGKSKMMMLAGARGPDTFQGPGRGESNWGSGDDQALADRFASDFPRQRPRFAMIHLRAPDYIGHKRHWMSADYLAAVREADLAIGTIVAAIDGSGIADRTALLLTSDHGGDRDEHVSGNAPSETIPWLCRVPGVKPRQITGTVRTVDVAPTGLALLRLPPLEGIDGKVVAACLP